MGPLPLFFFLNDVPKIMNERSLLISFADDTSILYTNSICTNYSKDIHTLFELMNKWFKENFVSLDFEETHHFHFITKNNPALNMKIGDVNELTPTVLHTQFLGVNMIVLCAGELVQNSLYLNKVLLVV